MALATDRLFYWLGGGVEGEISFSDWLEYKKLGYRMKTFKAFRVVLPSGLTVHNAASLQATDFVTKSYLSRNSIIACKVYAKNIWMQLSYFIVSVQINVNVVGSAMTLQPGSVHFNVYICESQSHRSMRSWDPISLKILDCWDLLFIFRPGLLSK